MPGAALYLGLDVGTQVCDAHTASACRQQGAFHIEPLRGMLPCMPAACCRRCGRSRVASVQQQDGRACRAHTTVSSHATGREGARV
jgi:hypothetical protein